MNPYSCKKGTWNKRNFSHPSAPAFIIKEKGGAPFCVTWYNEIYQPDQKQSKIG